MLTSYNFIRSRRSHRSIYQSFSRFYILRSQTTLHSALSKRSCFFLSFTSSEEDIVVDTEELNYTDKILTRCTTRTDRALIYTIFWNIGPMCTLFFLPKRISVPRNQFLGQNMVQDPRKGSYYLAMSRKIWQHPSKIQLNLSKIDKVHPKSQNGFWISNFENQNPVKDFIEWFLPPSL